MVHPCGELARGQWRRRGGFFSACGRGILVSSHHIRKGNIPIGIFVVLGSGLSARSVESVSKMIKIYIVPIEIFTDPGGIVRRGPEYFNWRFDQNPPSINCQWGLMDYGFIPVGLLVARDITQIDHDAVTQNVDVYAFPDDLDQPITDPGIDIFFEGIGIPTNWLTPSTTYRELLRYVAGMFQFNQRYGGISGVNASVFDNGRTLDSRWNSLSAQEKTWFESTMASFGFPNGVPGNPPLRTLAKQAGDLWGDTPFVIGGVEF